MIYFRLCKDGYAKSVTEAAELPASIVLQALAFEDFMSDFERTYLRMNEG